MKTALTVVMTLALVPQIIFTIRYWKKSPQWTKNLWGRLAQLGCWCHILLLTIYLVFTWFGRYFNVLFAEILLVSAFVPLIFYGVFQLMLLEKALELAEAAKEELLEEEVVKK